MLLDLINPLLKYLLVAGGNLVTFNQVLHNLIVGLLLVGVDGFDFEVESLLTCFKSLKTFSLLLLDILDSNDISL